MKINKGRFIVFEGLDGSGQSTQAQMLADYLISKGRQVLTSKEPTKTSPFAASIREILTEKNFVSPEELQGLFAKDRQWHIKEIVLPALGRGEWVVCDRYVFSSFAFGMASGVSYDVINKMNENYLEPDVVFFIDANPEICVERITKRGKGIDLFEKLPILQKVRGNYLNVLPKDGPINVGYVNGNQSINDVFGQIKAVIDKNMLLA